MNENATPPVTIQQKITQNGCGAGCGKGCLILAALIIGFLAFATHSCSSIFQETKEKISQGKPAASPLVQTNAAFQKLKQSIDEAKQEMSANPAPLIQAATRAIVEEKTTYKSMTFKNLEIRKHAEGRLLIQHFTLDGNPRRLGFLERTPGDFSDIAPSSLQRYIDDSTTEQKSEPRDDPAVVEARKAKAARAYSKPLPDIREEIAKRTREHAQNKLNPKRLTLLDIERRTHKLGTVWIQRFIADGKKWRTGFLESGGILSQIAPKTLQTYIDESTPSP